MRALCPAYRSQTAGKAAARIRDRPRRACCRSLFMRDMRMIRVYADIAHKSVISTALYGCFPVFSYIYVSRGRLPVAGKGILRRPACACLRLYRRRLRKQGQHRKRSRERKPREMPALKERVGPPDRRPGCPGFETYESSGSPTTSKEHGNRKGRADRADKTSMPPADIRRHTNNRKEDGRVTPP